MVAVRHGLTQLRVTCFHHYVAKDGPELPILYLDLLYKGLRAGLVLGSAWDS